MNFSDIRGEDFSRSISQAPFEDIGEVFKKILGIIFQNHTHFFVTPSLFKITTFRLEGVFIKIKIKIKISLRTFYFLPLSYF